MTVKPNSEVIAAAKAITKWASNEPMENIDTGVAAINDLCKEAYKQGYRAALDRLRSGKPNKE